MTFVDRVRAYPAAHPGVGWGAAAVIVGLLLLVFVLPAIRDWLLPSQSPVMTANGSGTTVDLSGVNTKIDSLVESINRGIKTLNDNDEKLQNGVEAVEGRVEKLETDVNELKSKVETRDGSDKTSAAEPKTKDAEEKSTAKTESKVTDAEKDSDETAKADKIEDRISKDDSSEEATAYGRRDFEWSCPLVVYEKLRSEGVLQKLKDADYEDRKRIFELYCGSKSIAEAEVPVAPVAEGFDVKDCPGQRCATTVADVEVVVEQPPVYTKRKRRYDFECNTCEVFNQLQGESGYRYVSDNSGYTEASTYYESPEEDPEVHFDTRATRGEVCVYVLQRRPSAVVLRDGPNNRGDAIVGWKAETVGWRKTSRGYLGKICFEDGLIASKRAVTLCGERGHSTWRRRHIEELLSRRVIPSSDPACLLGTRQCARYGL